LVRAQGRARLKAASDELVLVYYGFLYRSKGIETLLRAVAMFRDMHPHVRLVLVGASLDDYDKELHDLAAELMLSRELEWVGHCEPDADDASILIHAADVFVLPFDEGIRLNNSSFAVGAAHGVPIVTTAGLDLEAPFLHGGNVWLCAPKDPAALMKAIRTLALDATLCGKLRTGARRLAEETFSWQRNVAATLEVISA
jgi:glycosyltransferase involved in cell wall biosynthesis